MFRAVDSGELPQPGRILAGSFTPPIVEDPFASTPAPTPPSPESVRVVQPFGSTPLVDGLGIGTLAMVVQNPAIYGSTFPFFVKIDFEVIQVTSGAGTAASPFVIVRAQNGTAAAAHVAGSAVFADDWDPNRGVMAIISQQLLVGGLAVMLAAGTPSVAPWLASTDYQCLSNGSAQAGGVGVPSNATIYGTPKTRIVQTLGTGGLDDSALSALPTQGAVFPLAANNTIGTKIIRTVGNPGVGNIVRVLQNGNLRGSTYIVKAAAIVGVGPNFDLTLDRPVLYDFTTAAGANAQVLVSRPENIRVFGNGMTITGVGALYVEWATAYRCLLQDVNLDDTGGAAPSVGVNLDIGSVDCDIVRVRSTSAITATALQTESGERVRWISCYATGAQIGFGLLDSVECEVLDCAGPGNTLRGITFDGIVAAAKGCNNCRVVGGMFDGNSTAGIFITRGSTAISLSAVSSRFNGIGIDLDTTTAACSDTTIANATVAQNTIGLRVQAGVKGSTISGIDVSNCTSNGIQILDNLTASGVVSKGGSAGGVFTFDAACDVTLSNVDITQDQAQGITWTAAAKVQISGLHNRFAVNGCIAFLLVAAGAKLTFDNVLLDGPGLASSNGVQAGAANTIIREGNGVRMQGCAQRYNLTMPAQLNHTVNGADAGPVAFAANGVNPVAVPFTDIQENDKVLVQPISGAVVTGYTIVVTPGVGFTYTGQAGDTGNRDWWVFGG